MDQGEPAGRPEQELKRRKSASGAPRKSRVPGEISGLAFGSLGFRLSRAAREQIEAELIRRAVGNLNARVAAAAQAMGVPLARVRIEEVDFGARGDAPPIVPMARAAAMSTDAVAEPSFDAGLSTQRIELTAKVCFVQP